MTFARRMVTVLSSLAVMAGLSACAHNKISGTKIDDTEENRAVFEVVNSYRQALVDRDSAKLLSLVSESYVEDMGTPDSDDDYGYRQLKEKIVPNSLTIAGKYQLSVEVQDIVVEGSQAFANIRFIARARLDLPSGEAWDTQRDFNRIVFEQDQGSGRWLIVSGL